VRVRSQPAPSASHDPDAGTATSAPAERSEPAAPLRARGAAPAGLAAPHAREAATVLAHDAAIPQRVEPPAPGPRGDRLAVSRIENVNPPVTTVMPSGMPEPLRMASRADRVAEPAADRASARGVAVSARLSPAAALHAAFQWVSAQPVDERSPATPRDASRPTPSPRGEVRPVERSITGAGASAGAGADAGAGIGAGVGPSADPGARTSPARRDALAPVVPAADRTPAPRTLHIGSIEVEIQAPRDGADRDPRPQPSAPVAPAAPLARGFTTPLGLRQG
jgi:hypothetical protein